MILPGRETVYPLKGEERLSLYSEIEEKEMLGLPDPKKGERITAFIIPQKDGDIHPEGLRPMRKSRLGGFQVPKEGEIGEEMPQGAAGNIRNRQLKNR